MENISKVFGRNFRSLIDERDIKQVDIARELKTTTTTVQRWLNGDVWPSETNITQLAEFLEVSPVYFFQEEIQELPRTSESNFYKNVSDFLFKISKLSERNRGIVLKSVDQMIAAQEFQSAKKKSS
jgi:transcriptional regulator with XRE-family HTH domain